LENIIIYGYALLSSYFLIYDTIHNLLLQFGYNILKCKRVMGTHCGWYTISPA